MKKRFPVDIFTVKEYGVDRWLEDFFWPVSDIEMMGVYDDMNRFITDLATREDSILRWTLTVRSDMKEEYFDFIHVLKVIKEVESMGIEIQFSDETKWYKSILNDDKEIDTNFKQMEVALGHRYNIRNIDIFKNLVKKVLYNNIFTRPLIFKKTKRGEVIHIYSSLESLMEQHIKRLPNQVRFTLQSDWLPERMDYELPDDIRKGVARLTDSVTDGLESIALKIGVRFSDRHIAHLKKVTKDEFASTAKAIFLVKEKIKDKGEINLLLSAAGNLFGRALCAAIQSNGGEVTSFAHGGNVGFLNLPISMAFLINTFIADNFVTYTDESVKLYRRIKTNYSIEKDDLNILSAESPLYYRLWSRYRNKRLPGKVRRVMIIGFPHHQWRRPVMGEFSMTQLDLELRLIDVLKKAGFEVIYKAHPVRLREVEGIFDDKAKVIRGSFENYLGKADAFLFPCVGTTCFAAALCTNKPIIALDINFKVPKPFPEPVELLKKRCTIVSTEYDRRNRVIFDQDQLIRALSRKPEPPNDEFLERYHFPKDIL